MENICTSVETALCMYNSEVGTLQFNKERLRQLVQYQSFPYIASFYLNTAAIQIVLKKENYLLN